MGNGGQKGTEAGRVEQLTYDLFGGKQNISEKIAVKSEKENVWWLKLNKN